MGVIAVPTDVPYHVQEEHHPLQRSPRLLLVQHPLRRTLLYPFLCYRGLQLIVNEPL
jgi:hypothetical protein